MITLITPNGNNIIAPGDWKEFYASYLKQNNTPGLALIIGTEAGQNTVLLANTSIMPESCFNFKTIVDFEVLKQCFYFDNSFAPLLGAFQDNQFQEPSSTEIVLLSYFYLNPLPFSTTLITNYFSETGTSDSRAEKLASLAFLARVNKGESDPWFLIEAEKQNIAQHADPSVSLDEVLKTYSLNKNTTILFDCIDQVSGIDTDQTNKINLSTINECNFLIEDHAHIICGLSVKISEFIKLTETKWPQFSTLLFSEVPIYLRDFYSVGKLIHDKPSIFDLLNQAYKCETSIICMFNDETQQQQSIDSVNIHRKSDETARGLPVFLSIRK